MPKKNKNNNRHFSLNIDIRGMESSPTLLINERSEKLRSKGAKIYKLGLGQSPFPVPSPVVNALKLHAHEKDYLPVIGLPALRKAVAEFHRKKDNVNVQANNVLVGPGSKELLFLLQLVFYGEIIVPTPCWVSYEPQAKIVGRKILLPPTTYEGRWRMTANRLAEFCECEKDAYRPRLLVLNYPGNPDGLTYTAQELKGIAKVAREFEIVILADEIYARLHHTGDHVSIAQFYPEGTIISSGLSKWCGAGGWRLGTFSFPPDMDWLMAAMASVASETYTSVSAPIQYAAVRAFRAGVYIERYLWHVRRILKRIGGECHTILSEAGICVHPPEGAFYLFLDFSPFKDRLAKHGIKDSPALCEKLLGEKHVACVPGRSFGRPAEELTARLAYVDFDGATALSASENIPLDSILPDDFTQKWCGDVLTGSKAIAQWVTNL
ncbi:MAG: pyridoxal phosphate-dependent aminotransferase [Thermoplasmata archaeon]|nr:MAG: pyridoxal phosphate-dependent aminotransferase [Thermoplasmata archaeon]